jgi:hypothetical protein
MIVLVDGAHIRAMPRYQIRRIGVTLGEIEASGSGLRRFAVAVKGSISPLAGMHQALKQQVWQPGRCVTVLSDGEAAFPVLIRAAIDEQGTCIPDSWDILMRVRHLIGDGWQQEARNESFCPRHMASEVAYMNGEMFRPTVVRLLWNRHDLSASLERHRVYY